MNGTESGRSNQLPRQRRMLLALLAVQAAAIAWAGRTGGLAGLASLARSLRRPDGQVMIPQEWRRTLARDPKPGARLPAVHLKDSDGTGVSIPVAGHPGGILFIGSCTDCVAGRVAYWDELQREHPEAALYVAPVSAASAVIREFKLSHRLGVPFIADGQDKLAAAYNPFFLPRAYLFNESGRITYVQPPSVPIDAALARAGALLSAKAADRKPSVRHGHAF